ncbi:MAG TPA: putative sugar nucleotidyl transferase [Candidatus Deferrimicrobium sp.]|nr:putative sugar nucleotidyl transferase [Candidatus Deferrimicrobium sp.]
MPVTICFYEDETFRNFFPLTMLRPVYTLRAGIVPLFRRTERYFKATNVSLLAREQVAPLVAETYRDFPVNIIKRGTGEVLFVNGRIRGYGDLPELVKQARMSTVFESHDGVAAVLFRLELLKSIPEITTQQEFVELHRRETDNFLRQRTTASLYGYCWDVVADIESEIMADFSHLKNSLAGPRKVFVQDGSHLVRPEEIYLGDGVQILPGAVVDASDGPVFLGEYVRVEPHAAIFGPCYVGPNTTILAGKISGSSIGHTCRVGGEVEGSVFQAYVNKYHAGFIGHSYVGQWVNFGAMTTNSDLKNNYSPIRVTLNGSVVDCGSIKVGSFIGDHTKFGIGTLLTTGITIGACCNIFGGSLVTDREVPPFSWGESGAYERYEFSKAIDTALKVAARRNVTLSAREIAVLQAVFDSALTDDGVIRF